MGPESTADYSYVVQLALTLFEVLMEKFCGTEAGIWRTK